jgi:hypothetical protein
MTGAYMLGVVSGVILAVVVWVLLAALADDLDDLDETSEHPSKTVR